MSLSDYVSLLRWTAEQKETGSGREIPESLRAVVSRLGIDVSMWRELVWNFQGYFGKSCCAGTPDGMSAFAESTGRKWARGGRHAAECFVATAT